jgi:hypothetical protein
LVSTIRSSTPTPRPHPVTQLTNAWQRGLQPVIACTPKQPCLRPCVRSRGLAVSLHSHGLNEAADIGIAFCTGGDVLAGGVAVQGEQRSHGARQSRGGTSEHIPIEHLGEQGDSLSALETKQNCRRCWTVYGFRRRALGPSRAQQEPQGGALFCLLMALRRTEMRRGPFVAIRQPMNVTAAMLWCSPFRHWPAQLRSERLQRSSPGEG